MALIDDIEFYGRAVAAGELPATRRPNSSPATAAASSPSPARPAG